MSEVYIATDPYRPPVREAPSNDIPFIFNSGEELPAGVEGQARSNPVTGPRDELTCRDRARRAIA